jgi:protein gp37
MSANSKIEWCDATFNIAWGCIKVGPGCEHCYAETLAKRYGHDVWGPAKTTPRRTFGPRHWAEPLKWNRDAEKEGVRRRVFCSSMADVFEDHPTITEEREKLWPLIRATPWLDWLLLTKRPERIQQSLPADWPFNGYPNVWLGTSIENADYLHRLPHLLDVPAPVHFVSAEPLLGPLPIGAKLRHYGGLGKLDWVIVGGESGPRAREFHLGWALDLIVESLAFDFKVFVKQLGRRPIVENDDHSEDWPGASVPLADTYEPQYQGEDAPLRLNDSKGGDWSEWPEYLKVRSYPR